MRSQLDDKDKVMNYIYHGVNEKIFRPLGESKQEILEKYPKTMKSLGFEGDAVNIAIVAANQVFRKPFDFMFRIVRTFIDSHPDLKVKLYCHTQMDIARGGWNLVDLAKHFDLAEITIFAHPNHIHTGGYSEMDLSRIYNTATLTLYTTTGEGFGMIPTESMACGTPVLVTNYTSPPELVEPFSEFKVKVSDYFLTPRPLLRKAMPDVDDAVAKMTKLATTDSDYYLKKCSLYAHEKFAWRKVLPQWTDRLKEIEKAFDEECIEIPKPKLKTELITCK